MDNMTLETGVLYAANMPSSQRARPVRILDTRRWTSACLPSLDGFQWRLDPPAEWRTHPRDVGMAALYWSNTGNTEPDPQALLDFPWPSLPKDREAAGEELTRRAAAVTTTADGSWLCLRPVARENIVCRWEEYDYEQLQEERRIAHGRLLLEWKEANRRLTALGLGPVEAEIGAYTATITLDQLTALLDRAEQHA